MRPTQKLKSIKGFVNTYINKLPFESHIPGYQFCRLGTMLKERLPLENIHIFYF
jgi:hypothetical protein